MRFNVVIKSSCLKDSNYIEKSLPHYLTALAKIGM